ncbi:MAG: hypothetical protein AB8C84_11970 [Oligoflexales bacterium]
MFLLLLSLVPLFTAPLLHRFFAKNQKIRLLTNRSLIFAVAALIVLHILPESFHVIGWYAPFLALCGLVVPSSLERLWTSEKWAIHAVPVWLMVIGLAGHGLMDGAGLATPLAHHAHGHAHSHSHSHSLPLAILLHRLPVGLMIWGVFYPNHGVRQPLIYLSAIGISTVVGYFVGQYWFLSHEPWAAGVEAVVAGALLHIAFDRHDDGAACHAHHS